MTDERGFLLLDALAAFALLSVALVAISGVFDGAVRGARAAQDAESLAAVARSELAVLDVGEAGERDAQAGAPWRVRVETGAGVAAGAMRAVPVTLTVEGRGRTLTLRTWRLEGPERAP